MLLYLIFSSVVTCCAFSSTENLFVHISSCCLPFTHHGFFYLVLHDQTIVICGVLSSTTKENGKNSSLAMQKDIQHWLKCILTVSIQGTVSEDTLYTQLKISLVSLLLLEQYIVRSSDNNINSCSGRKTAVLIGQMCDLDF